MDKVKVPIDKEYQEELADYMEEAIKRGHNTEEFIQAAIEEKVRTK